MPRTHRHGRNRPASKRVRAGNLHRYPVCAATGKRRLGERKDVILALAAAMRSRACAEMDGVPTHRHEVRGYRCPACHGWHLTSRTGS